MHFENERIQNSKDEHMHIILKNYFKNVYLVCVHICLTVHVEVRKQVRGVSFQAQSGLTGSILTCLVIILAQDGLF